MSRACTYRRGDYSIIFPPHGTLLVGNRRVVVNFSLTVLLVGQRLVGRNLLVDHPPHQKSREAAPLFRLFLFVGRSPRQFNRLVVALVVVCWSPRCFPPRRAPPRALPPLTPSGRSGLGALVKASVEEGEYI